MKTKIRDVEALLAISPSALSAYALAAGWSKIETFGEHSNVFAHESFPEVILPRTQELGDYARVVSKLIEIFASAAALDELSLYRELVAADRDVIRVWVPSAEPGVLGMNDGIELVNGTRDMLLAAACSLQHPKPLYRTGTNRVANKFLEQVRWGQTEQNCFAITLWPPVIPPVVQPALDRDWASEDDPLERRITKRLTEALKATRRATELTVGGNTGAFSQAVSDGVSANLCEALVQLVTLFPTLEISLTWARTRPMESVRTVHSFYRAEVPILSEAARSYRWQEPQPDLRLVGFVKRLTRDRSETEGTVTLRSIIDGQMKSVVAVMSQSDYQRAIQAHGDKSVVIVEGDLERMGRPWRILNPQIAAVLNIEDGQDNDD